MQRNKRLNWATPLSSAAGKNRRREQRGCEDFAGGAEGRQRLIRGPTEYAWSPWAWGEPLSLASRSPRAGPLGSEEL
jgi:hypothetical protein